MASTTLLACSELPRVSSVKLLSESIETLGNSLQASSVVEARVSSVKLLSESIEAVAVEFFSIKYELIVG